MIRDEVDWAGDEDEDDWADLFDARELNSRSNYRDIGDAKSNRNPQRADTAT
jgi:hypothetical protein